MEREKVIKLIRDIASGNDPYKTADAGYAEFRKDYYTKFLNALERDDTGAKFALDRICDKDSVDDITETMAWMESWLTF